MARDVECERELYVYAFDTMAYPVDRAGDDLASWERALLGITAGGGIAFKFNGPCTGGTPVSR